MCTKHTPPRGAWISDTHGTPGTRAEQGRREVLPTAAVLRVLPPTLTRSVLDPSADLGRASQTQPVLNQILDMSPRCTRSPVSPTCPVELSLTSVSPSHPRPAGQQTPCSRLSNTCRTCHLTALWLLPPDPSHPVLSPTAASLRPSCTLARDRLPLQTRHGCQSSPRVPAHRHTWISSLRTPSAQVPSPQATWPHGTPRTGRQTPAPAASHRVPRCPLPHVPGPASPLPSALHSKAHPQLSAPIHPAPQHPRLSKPLPPPRPFLTQRAGVPYTSPATLCVPDAPPGQKFQETKGLALLVL